MKSIIRQFGIVIFGITAMGFGCDKEEETKSLTLDDLCIYQNRKEEYSADMACGTSLIGRIENIQDGEVYYSSTYESLAVRAHVPGTVDCVIVGLICNAEEDLQLLEGKKTKFSATFYESNMKSPVAGLKLYYVRDFIEIK